MLRKLFQRKNEKISVIVIAYKMSRELPRTIFSLLPPYQQFINLSDIEIIIINNNAPYVPINVAHKHVKIVDVKNPKQSPVKAINYGLKIASHDLVGVMIDGARMASPGLLHKVVRASKLHHRPIISTHGFHLGPDRQVNSINNGYNQAVEDDLLEQSDWVNNGYNLFQISSFASYSVNGWFHPTSESNAIFMRRKMWNELGGYCEKFVLPGGGFANSDLYNRASTLANSELIKLIGEGTFHQVHGGVATNRPKESTIIADFCDEYLKIKGEKFKPVNRQAIYYGTVSEELRASKLWY